MHTPSSSRSSSMTTPSSKKRSISRMSRTTPMKTPTPADRFIPTRTAGMDFEISSYSLFSKENSLPKTDTSPSKELYKESLAQNMFDGKYNPGKTKVLAFRQSAPAPKAGHQNRNRVLYTQHATEPATKKPVRHIPDCEEKILDAPGLINDYYLNLLDWNIHNMLAVALGQTVYLWNASSGDITELCKTGSADDYITSLSWVKESSMATHLAVGTSKGVVQLWDTVEQKLKRKLGGHTERVGSLDWNSGFMLSSGARDSKIINHDVRKKTAVVNTFRNHEQEICGLKWSPDGIQIASGGNDNILNIWDSRRESALHTMTHHTAAVKALAWCPWQSNLLASGGGTADRHIRFWNTQTGACLNHVDTRSQVCSLIWSKHQQELVSSHGYSQNQLIVWKYPSMVKMAELKGHRERVLHMALSPDGQTVVSAAGDETLRFWKVFENDKLAAKRGGAESGSLLTGKTIR